MKTDQHKINFVDGVITHPANEIVKTKKTWLEKDIVLNVGFKESLTRCIASLMFPWPFLLIDHRLFVAVVIVMFYFFVTGLMHFCPVRYAWQHWVKHTDDPTVCDLAIELNVPVKTI